MAHADIPKEERPLQIISIELIRNTDGNMIHELKLNEENLERLMLHQDVIDNSVMVLSIAGALRKGKSFLLGFFLKYLEAKMGTNWLNKDDCIEGFEWRNGTEAVTHGIHIWSKPFLFENQSNRKVAILLMDTQGVFDCKSTKQDCANIFTLSSLISSVQIYNLMHQIQEDDLEHLEYFSEFGKLIEDQSKIKDARKPRLIFLVRDWGCPYQFPYGDVGGEAYVQKQLEVQEEENQQLECKKIRQNLNGGFLEIGGFLLPYPGTVVATNHQFVGQVKDIDKEFLKFVELLVPYVVSEKKLTTKRMNCRDVKGKDLLFYIKDYAKFLKCGHFSTLKREVEATATEYRKSAFDKAYQLYEYKMEKFFEKWNLVSMDDLKQHHTRSRKESLIEFTECPRIKVADDEQVSLMNLEQKIEDKYLSYEEKAYAIEEKKRNSASQKAYKMYEILMEQLFERSLASMDELIEHHTLTKEKVLKEFSNRHGLKVAEHEQLSLMKLDNEIEEKYFSYEDRAYAIAEENIKTAFVRAQTLYEDEMEKLFEKSMFVTKNTLEKHHTQTEEKSLAEFMKYPGIRVAQLEKSSLKELKYEISHTYSYYSKRTIQENIKDFAEEFFVPCCITSATVIVGTAVGSATLALSGGAVSILYYAGLKSCKPRKKSKST